MDGGSGARERHINFHSRPTPRKERRVAASTTPCCWLAFLADFGRFWLTFRCYTNALGSSCGHVLWMGFSDSTRLGERAERQQRQLQVEARGAPKKEGPQLQQQRYTQLTLALCCCCCCCCHGGCCSLTHYSLLLAPYISVFLAGSSPSLCTHLHHLSETPQTPAPARIDDASKPPLHPSAQPKHHSAPSMSSHT